MQTITMGQHVLLRQPSITDQEAFIERVIQSESLHTPWVYPPRTPEQFTAYISRIQTERWVGLLVCERNSLAWAGIINVSEIVRGFFQSAYLGFYAFCPLERKGYMREGLQLTVLYCFSELKLHRLEANIQPTNARSKRLVETCGFQREGFSPRYLQVGGQWRDHERWAILADEENESVIPVIM